MIDTEESPNTPSSSSDTDSKHAIKEALDKFTNYMPPDPPLYFSSKPKKITLIYPLKMSSSHSKGKAPVVSEVINS